MKAISNINKVLFVIITISAMIALIFFFGIKSREESFKEFSNSGYIIGKSEVAVGLTTTKYYFDNGTKYKKDYEKKYTFLNTDNESVKVNEDSFIHYSDKSISVFKKTAILNLGNLNDNVIKYYNLYVGSRLLYKENRYYIKNLDNEITFGDFLMKINENKYMIVSPKINLYLGNTKKEIIDSYLEFEFFDGNIVRIENQEFQMQNVSSNFYIELSNNIKIDLATKNIYLNNEVKLNLSQITIDKNDNIDLPKVEETKEVEEKTNPLNGITSGNIDINENEEVVDETEKLNDPVFLITDMEVTSNKFSAEIKYEDEDNLLTGEITLRIIETSTNKLVYESLESTGIRTFQIEVENLEENTSYVFVVNSDYVKNAETYNRDFIQKAFVTEPIGISISKNYFTTSEMSFEIEVDANTKVEELEISLIDPNDEIVKTYKAKVTDLIDDNIVVFDNLSSNTEYEVVLHNFLYKNSIISDQFNIQKKYKTLKRKPSFGEPIFTIDKKNAKFNIKVNNISDIDNGVNKYRYEIYDARNLLEEPVVLKVIETDSLGGADIYIDNEVIYRGVPYVYKLIATFYDNEKEYEYETEYSQVMQLDGVEFPSVRFETSEITFERISGNIIITDNGNTITFNESNIITIVYTDSSGNSKSFTSSGSPVIPFNVNNLRANETYTISVYSAVNLQDGNDVIDHCYIGSVILQTLPTKPFVLESAVETEDTTKAFKVIARLMSEKYIDNSLEANTLTNLTFNLYAGTNTNGELIRTITKVDRDIEEYSSELKTEYYDKSFTLDPSFFELKNQDLQSSYYTIEITNAYDYTTYKNNISIISNVVTVKSNGYVPDLPSDVNDSIEVNVIRNNNNPDNYRNDLNPETVVGYKIKARYDNSKRYAKRINYYLYDAKTNKLIDTIVYQVPNNSEIDYTYIYLKDGTDNEIVDNEFRRGNSYYITYTVDLDLNFDGETETVYPLEELNVTLKSKTLIPEKQSAIFLMYPSLSSSTGIKWKYKYTDVDNSLTEKTIYYKIDDKELGKEEISISNDFQVVEFPIDKSGYLNLYVYENLVKNSTPSYKKLIYQYYEVPYVYSGDRLSNDPLYSEKKFNITLETNRIIITILDYLEDSSFYDRVAAAKLIFKTNNSTKVLDNLSIEDNGTITVDIIEIEDFIEKDIIVEMYLYYDNGIMGYDNDSSSLYSFQTIKNNLYSGYYYILGNNYLNSSETAKNSLFKFSLVNDKITIIDQITMKSVEFNLTLDEAGYSYNYEYLFPKELSLAKLISDGSDTFSFNSIIPGISIMKADGKQNITSALTTATAFIELYGSGDDRIKDNVVYIDVYETNDSATESTKIDDSCKKVSVNDLKDGILIENLEPRKNYYIKVLADVKTGNDYVRTQLYDVNYQNNSKNYYFKTLGSVGVGDIYISYSASSYSQKYLKVDYTLEEIVGYDRIEYEVYRVENDKETLIDMEIEPNYIFTKSMTKYIAIPPETGITTSGNYKIVIRAFTKINYNGEESEIELEPYESTVYYFADLRKPYVGISSSRYNSGTKIDFRVNVFDYHRVTYLDSYQVAMYDSDGNDITPDVYKNQYYSTKSYNRIFQLDNLTINKTYYVKVKYVVNVKNDISSLQEEEKVYSVVAMNEDGTDIGKVYIATSSEDISKAILVFYDSYKLSKITDIRYSIYGSNLTVDNSVKFVPTLQTTEENTFYTFQLPDSFQEKGIYYIQLQFLTNGRVIDEEALQYNYVG